MMQPMLYKRSYDPNTKKYRNKEWEIVHRRPTVSTTETTKPFIIRLELGGVVTIYPNLIQKQERDMITNEILQYRYPLHSNHNYENKHFNNQRERQHEQQQSLSILRQYKIQGSDEPRLNCLLHTNATAATHMYDDADDGTSLILKQPGYRYGSITIKGRPYDDKLQHTYRLNKDMEFLCMQNDPTTALLSDSRNDNRTNAEMIEEEDRCSIFNIGAHIVLYRDGYDKMGFHSDNDQNESYILTTILSQQLPRDIVFKPKQLNIQANDESEPPPCFEIHYKLQLNEGDAYSMDGVMQESYLHGVPKGKDIIKQSIKDVSQRQSNAMNDDEDEEVEEDDSNNTIAQPASPQTINPYRRLVIVFRRGKYVCYKNDSGRPMGHQDLLQQLSHNINGCSSTRIRYTFGHIPNQLSEGNIYTRHQLVTMGAHLLSQRSVSGNAKIGCNAIIISGLKHNCYSEDKYHHLKYCATGKEGAHALLKSYEDETYIRVFRSSRYDISIVLEQDGNCTDRSEKQRTSNFYRYDGLYMINEATELSRSCENSSVFVFEMDKM